MASLGRDSQQCQAKNLHLGWNFLKVNETISFATRGYEIEIRFCSWNYQSRRSAAAVVPFWRDLPVHLLRELEESTSQTKLKTKLDSEILGSLQLKYVMCRPRNLEKDCPSSRREEGAKGGLKRFSKSASFLCCLFWIHTFKIAVWMQSRGWKEQESSIHSQFLLCSVDKV